MNGHLAFVVKELLSDKEWMIPKHLLLLKTFFIPKDLLSNKEWMLP